MKKLSLILVVFFSSTFLMESYAQNILKNIFGGKKLEATLVVSSSGENKDVAVKAGLRNALEQAYGTFISSNTKLVNDEVVSDEIVDLSRGNIKNFKELSSSISEESGAAIVSLEVVVSLNKLAEYVQSKGASIEFAGANFDANMKMIELNKANERKVLDDLARQLSEMPIVDCNLRVNSPVAENADYNGNFRNYIIEGVVLCTANDNTRQYNELIVNTLKALSMSKKEREQYDKLNIRYSSVSMYKLPYNVQLLEEKNPIKQLAHASDECRTFYLRNVYNNHPLLNDYIQLTNTSHYMPSLFRLEHDGLLYQILCRVKIEAESNGASTMKTCWAHSLYNGRWSYGSYSVNPEVFCMDPALLGNKWDWVPSITSKSFGKKKFELASTLRSAYEKNSAENKPSTSLRSVHKGEVCALMPFCIVIPKEEIAKYTRFNVVFK